MPNIGNLIFNLPTQSKKLVRNIEKCNKKIVNNLYAKAFNETCINENILPNYTNIYIYIYMHMLAHLQVN